VLCSGGRTVTVTGTNFLSVQQPVFHLADENHQYGSHVSVTNMLKYDEYYSSSTVLLIKFYFLVLAF